MIFLVGAAAVAAEAGRGGSTRRGAGATSSSKSSAGPALRPRARKWPMSLPQSAMSTPSPQNQSAIAALPIRATTALLTMGVATAPNGDNAALVTQPAIRPVTPPGCEGRHALGRAHVCTPVPTAHHA